MASCGLGETVSRAHTLEVLEDVWVGGGGVRVYCCSCWICCRRVTVFLLGGGGVCEQVLPPTSVVTRFLFPAHLLPRYAHQRTRKKRGGGSGLFIGKTLG
jgi:hypothetical protein